MGAKEKELKRYEERSRKSRALLRGALKVIPLGCNSNYRTWEPYHLYFTRGKGPHVWDVDGNRYVDHMLAFGALVVGHAHPTLVRGMREAIGRGTMFAMPYDRSVELAELLQRRFKMDMWRLTNSGTEATMHALRLARAYTCRNKVVKMEGCYHGAHDALYVSAKPTLALAGEASHPIPVPGSLGMPPGSWQDTLVVPYNDLDAVERIFRDRGNEIAAVILEPIALNLGVVAPGEGYLKGLRELTEEYGALLIFDEVKTACKAVPDTAAQYYNIKPDILTMAKAIGGGYPLGAFGTRAEVAELLTQRKVAHLGTFNANPLVVNASLITLKEILTAGAFRRAAQLEKTLANGYRDIIADERMDAHVSEMGIHGCIYFTDEEVHNYRDFLAHDAKLFDLYLVAMMNRGVIPCGVQYDEQWTLSVQHTVNEVETHLAAFAEVAPLLKAP